MVVLIFLYFCIKVSDLADHSQDNRIYAFHLIGSYVHYLFMRLYRALPCSIVQFIAQISCGGGERGWPLVRCVRRQHASPSANRNTRRQGPLIVTTQFAVIMAASQILIGFGELSLDDRTLLAVHVELQHPFIMSDVRSDDDEFSRRRTSYGGRGRHVSLSQRETLSHDGWLLLFLAMTRYRSF